MLVAIMMIIIMITTICQVAFQHVSSLIHWTYERKTSGEACSDRKYNNNKVVFL